VTLRALAWNLYHGRDFPPDPALFTLRSRLWRVTERNATHVQLNRDLFAAFAAVLREAEWDVALLQETPPRWAVRLAQAAGAAGHRVLTARNWLLPVTSAIASYNPDLIASWEGGSNLTLVRSTPIAERRTLVLRRLSPERRVMAFTRLATGACIANLHASTADRLAEKEVRGAASTAVEWAGGAPLLLGGDFNLLPEETGVYADLRALGFSAPARRSIDQLLGHRMEPTAPPAPWPPERRELPCDGRALRPSDHAPLEATFALAPG
jgi:endonuclease/exonuclease/phosphatase family metal-dependent hydrolase